MPSKIAKNIQQIQDVAKKHHAKVSIAAAGKEVVLGDYRGDEPEVQEGVVLENLVNLVKTHISSIRVKKMHLKNKKTELEDKLLEDNAYMQAVAAVKNAQKIKKETKDRLIKQSKELQIMDADIKDMRTEVRAKQLSLFDYLLEYHNQTQATEIVDNIGERHQILIEAKIKI